MRTTSRDIDVYIILGLLVVLFAVIYIVTDPAKHQQPDSIEQPMLAPVNIPDKTLPPSIYSAEDLQEVSNTVEQAVAKGSVPDTASYKSVNLEEQ